MRLVLARVSRDHRSMTFDARPWRLAPTGALLAALAACSPTPQAASQANPPPASTTAAGLTAPQSVQTALLAPMPDPDHDERPDRAKGDDFAAHLERLQANMAAVDADF